MDPTSELETVIANSPPELAPYVSSNDILPSHFSTALEEYLLRLSQPMERLEAEIVALEKLLHLKKQSYERAKAVRDAHLRTTAPIRRIPQDVLGVVFPYVVDIPPFNKYIHVARLRSVCSSWRHVAQTTPGLWTSLEINLDKWCSAELDDYNHGALLVHFQEALAPWTSILSKTTSYQLNLTSNGGNSQQDNQITHKNPLVHYLFHLIPGPNIITVCSWPALIGALASSSASTRRLRVQDSSIGMYDTIRLEYSFPNLEFFSSNCDFDSNCLSLGHPSLAILHLDDVQGTVTSFMHLMQVLPALRELKINSSKTFDLEDDPPNPSKNYSHPSLEVLLVKGEDLLFLFHYLIFPALRFFTLEGLDMSTDPILVDEILPRIVSISSPRAFTLSLRGKLRQPVVEEIIKSLPSNSHIHFAPSRILNRQGPHNLTEGIISIESNNIERIFCDTRTGEFSTMLTRPANRNSSRPLTIHIPSDVGDTEVNRSRWEVLEGNGYHLELRPVAELDSMIRSLAPEYSPESPWD